MGTTGNASVAKSIVVETNASIIGTVLTTVIVETPPMIVGIERSVIVVERRIVDAVQVLTVIVIVRAVAAANITKIKCVEHNDKVPATAVVVMITTVDIEGNTVESIVERIAMKTLGMMDTAGDLVRIASRVGMEENPSTTEETSQTRRPMM